MDGVISDRDYGWMEIRGTVMNLLHQYKPLPLERFETSYRSQELFLWSPQDVQEISFLQAV